MKKGLIVLGIIVLLLGCKEAAIPKPRGYFRIGFPEKEYKVYSPNCPYKFEIPVYAKPEHNGIETKENPCWVNIAFPKFNAKIYISYIPVNENLAGLLEDTYNFAYKHVQKADAINNVSIERKADKVYGILYNIEGNVASSRQFFLTDSTHHYLRGALYFNEVPNKDSLSPVIDFISKDIDHIIESFKWKSQ